MTQATLIAIASSLATVAGAWLVYKATRERDAPHSEIERGRLELDDSKAALEAWAELATAVRDANKELRAEAIELRRERAIAQGRIVLLQGETRDQRVEIEKLKARNVVIEERAAELEQKAQALQSSLDECLSWRDHRTPLDA